MLMIYKRGSWYIPENRPCIGGLLVRYDKSQEETREKVGTAKTPSQTKSLNQALSEFFPRIGSGQQSFQGDRVAGQNVTQQQAISGAGDFLEQFAAQRDLPLIDTTNETLTRFLQGLGGASQIDTARANEVFDVTRQQPALRNFERFTAPLVAEQFAGPNFDSSARAREVTREGEFLSQALRGERENFLFNTENINRQIQEDAANRALSSAGLAPTIAGTPTAIARQDLAGRADVFDFASQEQFQRQAEINADIQRFQESIAFMDPNDFAILATLLGLDFSKEVDRDFALSSFEKGAGAAAQPIGGAIGLATIGAAGL